MNSATLPPLDQFFANTGESLQALSERVPVLLVFLRHSGCPFCRQTLADLANQRSTIERAGLQIVLVHMMTDVDAADLFGRYQLTDLPRIDDIDGKLYQRLGRKPGTVNQVMGPRVWGGMASRRRCSNGMGWGSQRETSSACQERSSFTVGRLSNRSSRSVRSNDSTSEN